MNKPKISIIVPIYKADVYLSKCLDSIANQTFLDWECILVDDGSPDNSGKICDEYSNRDSRFRPIHKSNGGVSSARQTGLDAAIGEYVIHADPDDWMECEMLESLYNKAKKDNADFVLCDLIMESARGRYTVSQNPECVNSKTIIKKLLLQRIHGACWNKLVRREIILKYNVKFPKGIDLWEDLFFNITLLVNNIKCSYLPVAFYHYLQDVNPNSLRQVSDGAIQSIKKVIERLDPILVPMGFAFELKFLKVRLYDYYFLNSNGDVPVFQDQKFTQWYMKNIAFDIKNPLRSSVRLRMLGVPPWGAWNSYIVLLNLLKFFVKIKHLFKYEKI